MEEIRIPIFGEEEVKKKKIRVFDLVTTDEGSVIEIKQRHSLSKIRLEEFYKQIKRIGQ